MPLSGITILAVDDNEAHGYVLKKTLQKLGSEVLSAATGSAALAMAKSLPDVILLDLRLPDLNGFEVCRRLKADPATAGIPVIFFSALSDDPHTKLLVERVGGSGFLSFPIDEQRLISALRGQTVNLRSNQ